MLDFEEEDIQAPKSQSDVFSQDDAGDIFSALAISAPSISFEDFLQPLSFPLDPPPPLDQTWESLSAHAMSVMASFNFHDDAYFRYQRSNPFFFRSLVLIVSVLFFFVCLRSRQLSQSSYLSFIFRLLSHFSSILSSASRSSFLFPRSFLYELDWPFLSRLGEKEHLEDPPVPYYIPTEPIHCIVPNAPPPTTAHMPIVEK